MVPQRIVLMVNTAEWHPNCILLRRKVLAVGVSNCGTSFTLGVIADHIAYERFNAHPNSSRSSPHSKAQMLMTLRHPS